MTNIPTPRMTDPEQQSDPPQRLPRMRYAWGMFGLFVLMVAAQLAVIDTWEQGDCSIGLAMLCLLGVWITAALVPVVTLVQQVRSPRGHRRVAQSVTLYVLSVIVLAPVSLFMLMPIIFADTC